MHQPIQFYFDFSSPYGYFASEKIEAIAARHGRDVEWRPVLLGAIFKVTGGQPLPLLPIKGTYYKHDFSRSARLLGIPYRLPSAMPISGVAPSRAFYWLNEQDASQAKELAKRLFRGYFVDDIDISYRKRAFHSRGFRHRQAGARRGNQRSTYKGKTQERSPNGYGQRCFWLTLFHYRRRAISWSGSPGSGRQVACDGRLVARSHQVNGVRSTGRHDFFLPQVVRQ